MEDTTVLTGEVITMERDKLKMNPLPQDQTPMLTPRLMAGVSFTVMTKSDLIDNKKRSELLWHSCHFTYPPTPTQTMSTLSQL